MRQRPESLAAAVRDFRELTAQGSEGNATRARVLAQAAARPRLRRVRLGGTSLLLMVAIGSAAVAATEAIVHRTPAPIVLTASVSPTPKLSAESERRPTRTIPPLAPSGDPDRETSLYGAAHAAHFGPGSPQRALAAWSAYLRAYPHGRFEPEARFNRAICAIRLQRFSAAAADLVPFANGRYGDYRRAEAARLLDWMKPGRP